MVARIIPAATIVITLEDVMLDQLCFEHAREVLRDRRQAGKLAGYIEATLSANPGLADHGPLLPLGCTVHLPEFVITTENNTVRLWD
ncbi:phage tail protein [Ensifer adhaerens]|nr:phage tail protein [Ensifer adhaerens]